MLTKYFSLFGNTICFSIMPTLGKELWVGNKYEHCLFRRIPFTDVNSGKPGSVIIAGPIFITIRQDYNYGSGTIRK